MRVRTVVRTQASRSMSRSREVRSIGSRAGQGTASNQYYKKRVESLSDQGLLAGGGGTEALVCHPDNLSRKVFCLPGAHVRDVTFADRRDGKGKHVM